jgi:hypothetical protein
MAGSRPDEQTGIADEDAARVVGYLRAAGADDHGHAGGRSLLDHLLGTYEIVRRWDQPVWVQLAALIHSVYGTDVHREQLLPLARRSELVELVGERAERIAYLFCTTPRRPLLAGTYRWSPGAITPKTSEDGTPARADLDAVVLVHMANLAEQVHAEGGRPGLWLFKLRELAELLIDSDSVSLPLFIAGLANMSAVEERAARRAYLEALENARGPEDAGQRFALAAACPVLAEPCVWLAHEAYKRGDADLGRDWARAARSRLLAMGTAWDKRLSFDAWMEVISRLDRPAPAVHNGAGSAIADPRDLFDTLTGARPRADSGTTAPRIPTRPPDPGRARFQRYMDLLADGDEAALRGAYPDLESRPWYDEESFPLARALGSRASEIRAELLALDPERFHREAERIQREGDWDVVFLYERGRRHDDVCAACPVTTRVIESAGSMRTAAGLIYVSRMRPGTHISPHRGPTNLRLRCHLGVTVPPGDCAIRVGSHTRQWREGGCLVFSDYFEHEAWNRTDQDRIVLIVDLWHPELSPQEIDLLTGLHRYATAYGRRLHRYWAANAAAATESSHG